MTGLKQIPQRLARQWGALRITSKFGLAFGLLFLVLLMQTLIAYYTLTVTWNSNATILYSSETQRLVMVMSRNWETIRRLQQEFFAQAPVIGAHQAYQLYALPAGGKIAEVVQGGATLKRRGQLDEHGAGLQELDASLTLILANASQYASVFEEATRLQLQLAALDTGLYSQITEKAEALLAALGTSAETADMLTLYYQMRLFAEEYLATRQGAALAAAGASASDLQQAIEASALEADAKASALLALNNYTALANEIQQAELKVQAEIHQLDALGQSIEPSLIELMVSADTRVSRARLQIEQTRRAARSMLVAAMVIGLLSAGLIAALFHNSVTRVVIRLTEATSRFHKGDLEARSPVTSSDELGHLASAFNQMAETIQRRVTEVEGLQVVLRDQAIRDALTGLFNRRYLNETLPNQLETASHNGTPVTLVMLDIDHFKAINDRYGHAAGDKMLAELAAILSSQTRAGDITCRYGGEEFVVLLWGARLADAVRRANAWRQMFSAVVIPAHDGGCQASFSAGVVEQRPRESLEKLLMRADTELYRAKNAGRNRVSASAM